MRRAGDPRGGGTSAWLTAVRERRFNTPTEKLMMMVLCDYVGGDDECWPGNDTLAQDTGVEPKTIARSLARLESVGVIARRRRGPKVGRGRSADAITFLWDGFQNLPLVRDQGDEMSPGSPADQEDISADQEDIGGGVQEDISAPPSSFRTPQVEPPREPTPQPPAAGLAVSASRHPSPYPAAFEAFYAAYPRHEGKVAASRAWPGALSRVGGDARRIIDGAARYREDPNREPAYTAHPATWLNAGRWDDDPLPPRNGNGSARGPHPIARVDQRTMEAMDWAAERRARREAGDGT